MRDLRSLFFFFLVVAFLRLPAAYAEPPFYPNNFARTPIQTTEGATLEESNEEIEEVKKDASPASTQSPPNLAISSNREPVESSRGARIKWIEALVSVNPTEHFNQALTELLTTSDRFDIPLGRVMIVGRPENKQMLKDVLQALALRSADFSFEPEPPEEFQIESSPAWILGTEGGEIILEAVGPLSKFLNEHGEFVYPAGP